jgi:plasmid stabilization system protein ParE
MQVEITEFAKTELQNIYKYYLSVASKEVAEKIINRIIDEIEYLGKTPNIGSKELLLAHLDHDYKYIVCGNYKIIFYKSKTIIYITDIFDCRQNPEKMELRNS